MKSRKRDVKRSALYGAIGGVAIGVGQTLGTWTSGALVAKNLGVVIGLAVIGGLLWGLAAIVRNKFVD